MRSGGEPMTAKKPPKKASKDPIGARSSKRGRGKGDDGLNNRKAKQAAAHERRMSTVERPYMEERHQMTRHKKNQ
jgi:hypothetical protein